MHAPAIDGREERASAARSAGNAMAAYASVTIVDRAGRQPVESVGQVHRVAHAGDHHERHETEVEPRHDDRHAADVEHGRRSCAQVELAVVSGTATHVGRCGPVDRRAGRTRPRRRPARTASRAGAGRASARATTFDQSSMKPSRPHASIATSARRAQPRRRAHDQERRRDDEQDEHAAHRRSALLDEVPLRSVGAHLLADVANAQQADPQREQQRSRHHREHHREEDLVGRVLAASC